MGHSPHQKHHCPSRAGNCRMTEGVYQTYCRTHQRECVVHPKVLISINNDFCPACKVKAEMDAKRAREAEAAANAS